MNRSNIGFEKQLCSIQLTWIEYDGASGCAIYTDTHYTVVDASFQLSLEMYYIINSTLKWKLLANFNNMAGILCWVRNCNVMSTVAFVCCHCHGKIENKKKW